MNTPTRRKIGGLLVLLALIAIAILLLSDVRLVTMSSKHFDATGATVHAVHVHSPLVVSAVVFICGLVFLSFPDRRSIG